MGLVVTECPPVPQTQPNEDSWEGPPRCVPSSRPGSRLATSHFWKWDVILFFFFSPALISKFPGGIIDVTGFFANSTTQSEKPRAYTRPEVKAMLAAFQSSPSEGYS